VNTIKPIVIVGGGVAGIRAALDLDKRFGEDLEAPIFLIEPSPHHLFIPTLYSMANPEAPRAMHIAYSDIFRGTRVHHIQERVTHIDCELRHVITESRRLAYGDLIIALENSPRELRVKNSDDAMLACRTFDDLIAIRERIDHCFRVVRDLKSKECHNHFVIVGGGASGVEFAAGLYAFLGHESQRYNFSAAGVHITIVEASSQLLPGFSRSVAQKVAQRLKKQGIMIRLNTRMSWKGQTRLMLDDTVLPLQTVIWAAGATPPVIVTKIKGLRHDGQGRILVDGALQVLGQEGVWAVGDMASVKNSGFAGSAVLHGRHVAQALLAARTKTRVTAYHPTFSYPILQLDEGYGIGPVGDSIWEGKAALLYKQWSDWRYLNSILPAPSALHYLKQSSSFDGAARLNQKVLG
jgi:NADH:ubiquinone reductase (H+-translocating)